MQEVLRLQASGEAKKARTASRQLSAPFRAHSTATPCHGALAAEMGNLAAPELCSALWCGDFVAGEMRGDDGEGEGEGVFEGGRGRRQRGAVASRVVDHAHGAGGGGRGGALPRPRVHAVAGHVPLASHGGAVAGQGQHPRVRRPPRRRGVAHGAHEPHAGHEPHERVV